MAKPRWPVAIFDLDGTLVDTIPLIVASYQHAFETVLGRREAEERIRAWIGRPLATVFRELDAERARSLFDAYLAWNLANTERMIRRFDGVEALLSRVSGAGAAIVVVTSKLRDAAELALRLTGLTASVDLLLTAEDTQAHKPDPAPLLHALARLGARAGDACYVGDAVVDLVAAQRAGVAGVGVTWGAAAAHELRALAPAALCETIAELDGILVR
jgi:pyrophosphatase PpaX